MSDKFDLSEEKGKFRKLFTEYRKMMSEADKNEKDLEIIVRLLSLDKYNSCNTVLTYVSKEFEVDTKKLILAALANGKRVACPKTSRDGTEMEFYIINSLDDLVSGFFGILEPDTAICKKLDSFGQSICIIPGIGFDITGNRLGYGKGCYDRFLVDYNGYKIGLCYASCVKFKLPCESTDIPVNCIITEQYTRKVK